MTKKTASCAPSPRTLYGILLAVAIGLLWLLARPTPGLRITELSPVLAPGTPPPAPGRSIRVATYNLEHFTDARNDGPDRTPAQFMAQAQGAAAIIAEASPDILLLQEIENGRTLEYLNTLFEKPYPYIYVTRLLRPTGDPEPLNLGMLSRLPPRQVRQLSFHNLDRAGRPSRGTLAAEFDLGPDNRLLLYNLHLKSNYGEAPRNRAKRARALHQIADDAVARTFANDPMTTSVVLLGDTNVDPDTPAFADDPSLEPLGGSYVDLWRGRPIEERTTIPTRQAGPNGDTNLVFPPSAFDRVFVSHNLIEDGRWRVSQPETLQKGVQIHNNLAQPGTDGHVTDHHLVYIDLKR